MKDMLASSVFQATLAVLTFYVFMHDKGFSLWTYLGMFVILVAAGYGWQHVLPANSEDNKKKLINIANISALVLLAIVAVFVTI